MVNLNDTPSRGPLTESEADAAIRASWPPRRALVACAADACTQGRKACPCPQACLQPIDFDTRAKPEPEPAWLRWFTVRRFWAVYGAVLLAVAAGICAYLTHTASRGPL